MSGREKITSSDTTMDTIIKLSEGNPGGLTVIKQVLQKSEGFDGVMRLLDLDDMNMRGPQIWVGYKDHCGEDINKFIEAVKNRDPDMIKTVNSQCDDRFTAVISGASFNRN
jgi:hypothetical protein